MNKPNPIKFGTDGWRAVIGEEFTFENVRYCAQGVADYLKEAKLKDRGLVIGYDTRFASEDFAAAAAEVIAGNSIKAYLTTKPAPPPLLSSGLLPKNADGGAEWGSFESSQMLKGTRISGAPAAGASDEITS